MKNNSKGRLALQQYEKSLGITPVNPLFCLVHAWRSESVQVSACINFSNTSFQCRWNNARPGHYAIAGDPEVFFCFKKINKHEIQMQSKQFCNCINYTFKTLLHSKAAIVSVLPKTYKLQKPSLFTNVDRQFL